MQNKAAQPEVVLPLHTHYVNRECGTVYPAMRYPPGHEDRNPGDWRAATASEIQTFKDYGAAVAATMEYNADGSTKLSGVRTPIAGGGTIQLAPEDEVEDLGSSSMPAPPPVVIALAPEEPAVVPAAPALGALGALGAVGQNQQ